MKKILEDIIKKLFGTETEVAFTRPEPQFGDYATNVAMQLAKPLGRNPEKIEELLKK